MASANISRIYTRVSSFAYLVVLIAGVYGWPVFAQRGDVFSAGDRPQAAAGPVGPGTWIKLGPQQVHGSDGPYMWLPRCDELRDRWLYGVVVYANPQTIEQSSVHKLYGTGAISPTSPLSISDPRVRQRFELYAQQQRAVIGHPCRQPGVFIYGPAPRPPDNALGRPSVPITPYRPDKPASSLHPRLMCTTCDCADDNGGPASAHAYVSGLLQGFGSCLGGAFLGPISDIMADGHDFALVEQAFLRGDSATAAQVLAIKGERNRAQFDTFVKSLGPTLNPKIFGATPEQAGLRDGSRLCSFGVLPSLTKVIGGRPIVSPARILPRSGTPIRRVTLIGASANLPINHRAGGVGYVYEHVEGGNLPSSFKDIDAVARDEMAEALVREDPSTRGLITAPREITSIKTLGATPAQYQTPGRVLSTITKYLRDLKSYEDRCRNGVRVVVGPNTKRILKVGIPPSATAQQLAEIDEAILVGREMGIEVQVAQLEGVEGWEPF